MGTKHPEPAGLGNLTFHWTGRWNAPPEVVYATLADPSNALVWAGEQMPKNFRVLTLTAPPGEAGVGTEWSSTGADARGSFDDRSIVIGAERPRLFEYRTDADYTWKNGKKSTAELVHRYEIEPSGAGSQVSYLCRSTGLRPWKAPWNVVFATPGLHQLAQSMIKHMAGKGFTNLRRLAEARAEQRELPD